MSSLTTLARPYAKAAFELARSEQALGRWDDALVLASGIASEEDMASLLDSPEISKAKAASILMDTVGAASAEAVEGRFRDFISVLADNGRLPLLPQVSSLYHELREEAERRLSVKVVSAFPLDDDQAGRMREALARRFDCEIELENEIDAGVIGGAVVYAGDQVIDGSLRGRLQRLSNSLAN